MHPRRSACSSSRNCISGRRASTEERKSRSLHFATPEFLSRLVALANFMRLSLMKAAHADLSDVAKQEFGYATVGMTNLFGGTGLKASAHRVHSILNLPTGESAPPNEQNGWGRICELTWRALVWGKGAPQIPPLRYPRIPVEVGGAGELHAAFLNESRTRGSV